jgi:hypothetical protein
MGIYLSQPSTEITAESGGGKGIRYAVAEMQVSELTLHFSSPLNRPTNIRWVLGMEEKHGGFASITR